MLLEDLKEKCNIISRPICGERLSAAVEEVVRRGSINLDNADENTLPSAIMAAIFDDMKNACLYGSLNYNTEKSIKREYKKIRYLIPSSY